MPLSFEDFSAWIEVEGSALPLFDVKVNDRELSCWIPSEVGKAFVVKWATGTMNSHMAGVVYMDGKQAGGVAMGSGAPYLYKYSGILTSPTTEKPFVFSNVDVTDDDQYLNQATAGLGDIKLVISHATLNILGSGEYTKYNTIGKVHERSKKATGHKVDLRDAHSVPYTDTIDVIVGDTIVNFIFRYRPIELLRADGVAPPAPRTKSSVKGEVLDLTEDSEEEDTTRRIQSLEEELVQLRRKRRKTQHVKAEPEVKAEPGTSSLGSRDPNASHDVIDLT
ncbi:hypothetical protein EV361DRAFT_291144 [Lentinula raphanica]|uniref:DUF7918 domain-containing protein n=1 Tax=Lentinula raphanica TaxID=153919 RepID=A0AA38PJT4_9AGAR|nr:hypothetical protein F5878DRAFT_603376 [Lentinula raphanica]KAJ3970330.1 hypothetical protein EV361DRAFT_291144 [Lentinula raphanica]